MNSEQERQLKKHIIEAGRRLDYLRLAYGRSGNLSARLDKSTILITASGTCLGSLTEEDILKVDLESQDDSINKRITSEFPLHSSIYKNSSCRVVVHCHAVLVNAYFAVYSDIKALTFETRLYLGNIPVVRQDTPSVTRPELIIKALKESNIVVLQNHGVVVVADNFKNALCLVEVLEEAVRTCAAARLFNKEVLDDLDKQLKQVLENEEAYVMFSKEHIQEIVDLVNKDEFITEKGKELDLTLQLAIKLEGSPLCYKFTFDKGNISGLDFDDNAPFVISAPEEIWKLVFLGKLEPFVATMQGKMNLKGQIGQLSRWYVPFSRLFELFKQVRIK